MDKRVVIITGASGGIGEATARLFARRGDVVALVARSREKLEALAEDIRRDGGEALALPSDVTDRAAVADMVNRAVETYGHIDVLVNNAGRGLYGTVAGMEPDDFEALLRLNVLAPVWCLQAVVPHMRRRGGGVIVNVSSVAEKIPVPFMTPYSASKIALSYLTDAARIELSRDNIGVVAVLPGDTRTSFEANATHSGRDAGLNLEGFAGGATGGVTPDVVAEAIYQAVQQRPRQVVVGGMNRVAATVLHHGRAPLMGLFGWAINRYVPRPGETARRPQEDAMRAGAVAAAAAGLVVAPLLARRLRRQP